MAQLSLFDAAPAAHPRAARPDLPLLILASADHIVGARPAAPTFTKQATPEQARNLIADLNATTAAAFCLSRINGQETLKRAAEIAITGRHDLAVTGDAKAAFDICASIWQLRSPFDTADGKACAIIQHAAEFAPALPLLACPLDDFDGFDGGETSATIAARITQARARIDAAKGAARGGDPLTMPLDDKARNLMMQAHEAIGLNDHEAAGLLRVAETIAHMAAWSFIGRIHVAEALSYYRGYQA